MNIDRKKHWQFLEDELKAETEEFKKTYLTTAISLLKNSGGCMWRNSCRSRTER
jgi:DNA replication ATP-dependent helicase Dna2